MAYREKVSMGGHLVMSEKERLCMSIMKMVSQGRFTLKQAAEQCQLSYRQIKRLYRRYKAEGDAGVVHQARGQKSNRKHPHREMIIARYKERYEGFGPTLAAEKLQEDDQLYVDHDTLRGWLLEENIWHKQRKRSPYRRQRERYAQFGELIQIDGSIHDWLEEGRTRCLLNMVDDATGKTLAHMESGETTRCVFLVIWKWIERYGIPLAFYVDLKTVYVSKKNTTTFSHVEKACKKLGIRIIRAYSPQAKGRVERNHGVYQDRFVKELRLKKIKTIDGANMILENGFVDKLNMKFEKIPRNSLSAHRPLNDIDLNQILCWEYERQVNNDWTISFQNKIYQIEKSYGDLVRPKAKVFVRRHLDNSISAWYKEKKLSVTLLDSRPKNLPKAKVIDVTYSVSASARANKAKTPWSKFNPNWLKKTGT
jgi:transposase